MEEFTLGMFVFAIDGVVSFHEILNSSSMVLYRFVLSNGRNEG